MVDRRPFADRGRELYDWYARHDLVYGAVARLSRSLRREAVAALDPDPGDRILDVGCGPGVNVPLLADRVGPGGLVVELDSSRGMVRRTRERIRAGAHDRVDVVQADAAAAPFAAGRFDGAVATLALSAMPDATAVAREVARVLRPGGTFVALDADLSPDTAGHLYPLLERIYRRVANWNPAVDVVGAVEAAFEETTVLGRYDAGTSVLVRGRTE